MAVTSCAFSLPPLSKEEEYQLAAQMKQGDRKAREKLIRANYRFAMSQANKYTVQDLSIEDLRQEAMIGLMEGVDHFNPSRGTRLITCVSFWIKNAILKAINKCGAVPRLPDNEWRNLIRIQKALKDCPNIDSEEEKIKIVSDATGLTQEHIKMLLTISSPVTSLDENKGDKSDDCCSLSILLKDEKNPSPEEAALSACLKDDFYKALSSLPPVERRVFALRYGLYGNDFHSFAEIGKEYGQTKAWAFFKAKSVEKTLAKKMQEWA